jgi:hypothetical protein
MIGLGSILLAGKLDRDFVEAVDEEVGREEASRSP